MFKKVMGLIDKINQKNKEKLIESLPEEKIEDLLLNRDELRLILTIIKDSTFKGNQIEVIYNLTWKIQQALKAVQSTEQN
jgi:hypothetical protein